MAIKDFFGNMFGSKQVKEKAINVPGSPEIVYIQEQGGGSSGTEVHGGYMAEEYLTSLRGADRAKEFDKMANSDPQCKMLLSAVRNPIKGAGREIQPAGDTQEEAAHKLLCEQVLLNDIDIEEYINNHLTITKYGHVVFEKTHKIHANKPILNDEGKAVLQSYIGFKELTWISPKTIQTWNFSKETKKLESVWQLAHGDLDVNYYHPVRHLIISTLEKEGDNYEGVSMLRCCFGNYFRKREYFKLNAVAIEKSMPIPTGKVPTGKEKSQEFTNLVKVMKAFTSHQQNYILYPEGWDINLSDGTRYDPSKLEVSIDKEDIRMAKAFLANFLELGLSGGGAFALSNDLSDFFLSSLMCLAGLVEKSLNECCKELVILNFGKQSKYPTFKFTGISDKAGKELAEILDILTKSKILTPDDNLEDHMRKRLSITDRSDIGVRELTPPAGGFGFSEHKTLSEKVRAILNPRL